MFDRSKRRQRVTGGWTAVFVVVSALGLSACSSQEEELQKQLRSAGYTKVKAHADYDTKRVYNASKKRTETKRSLDDYEADAKVGTCVVHIEQDPGEKRYVVEAVNDRDVNWPNLTAAALRERAKQEGIQC